MPPPAPLILDTVVGAEDLLQEELSPVGRVRITEPGVIELDPAESMSAVLADLAGRDFYSGVRVRLPDAELDTSLPWLTFALSAIGLDGPAGYRVDQRDADQRRLLSTRIAALTGWAEAPSNWVINCRPDGPDLVVDIGPLHWSRRHHRLERLPWSTPVVVAEVLVRLAKVRPDDRLLDPCCGAGTNLVAAAQAGVRSLLGVDLDPAAVSAARTNLDRAGVQGRIRRGSATELDLKPGSIDRVVANLPFGKQVGSHGSNQELYPALLAGLSRALTPGGRMVLLTEDKGLFAETVQRTAGLKIIKQRLLRYSGASPTAYVISRTRSR